MKKGVAVGLIALGVLCVLPAFSQAKTKRIASKVAWTGTNSDPIEGSDPIYLGKVSSSSNRCVGGRKVKLVDEHGKHTTKTTDGNGKFVLTFDEYQTVVPGLIVRAKLQFKSFGHGKHKTICKGDEAKATYELPEVDATITDATYNSGTEFSGTFTSTGGCIAHRHIGLFLYHPDTQSSEQFGEFITSTNGSFTVNSSATVVPGTWYFAALLLLAPKFHQSDMTISVCNPAASDDIGVP